MPRRRIGKRDTLLPAVGWLFADLLLALAVLFMISTIPPKLTQHPKLTPTPTPTLVATILANQRILDLKHLRITINTDDPAALSVGDTGQKTSIAQQIRQLMSDKQHQQAGLVVVYGAARTDQEINQALNIATNVYAVVDDLGKHKFVFCNSVDYDPLFRFGAGLNPDTIVIDIYMYDFFSGCS